MSGKSRTKAVKPRVVPEDLEAVVREALHAAPGLKLAQLKKTLPAPYQAFAKEAQAALRQLAEHGEIWRLPNEKSEVFFERNPHVTLDELVPKRLSAEPLGKSALKELARELAPGSGVIFEPWFKSALVRGVLYAHAASPPSREKRYGTEPDLRGPLTAVFAALRKAIAKTDAQGVSRHLVAERLLAELGVSLAPAKVNGVPHTHAPHEQFLVSLQGLVAENPRQALLSIRDLRARLALDKQLFDTVALDLMRDGKVSLHHHDHPASLPEGDRNQLVQDGRGNYYIGIAPGRGS